MIRRREFPRGAVLRVHLTDNTSVEGVYVRSRRSYLELAAAKVEADGGWRATKNEALLVPRKPEDRVKLIEVVAS